MKKLFFFCSVMAIGLAKPNGYFHQEYSYKSSSSSFKNNELQHKKDDQGFYSKDGDLEGRVKPKVRSQSEHSEYTNPKLLGGSGGYQTGGFGGGNSANYLASSDRLFGGVSGLQSAGAVDGYASSDRVLDLTNAYNSRGYGSSLGSGGVYGTGGSNYGYTQGGSSYGYVQHGSQATSGNFGTNTNLNALMQRLQDDMTRQMEHAINSQYQSSGYSQTQMNTDMRLLEDELRRNLTRQLQDSLRSQYGSGTYSIVEGRPAYSSQELASLTRRLEEDLISKLHQTVKTTYNRESSSSYVSSQTHRPVYPSTTLRPYYERPIITTPMDIRYAVTPSVVTYPGSLVVETPTNIRYTPVANPESLTQIASRTQAEINSHLDTALENLYSTYLQTGRTSYYTMADFDNEVNRIRDDIIRNLTYNLDDQIRRNYGQQILKNDYYYTISSNGDISTQHNYNLRDYESLKKQVEENLLRKLNQTVNGYRDQYQRRQSQSSTYAVTYRPTYYTSGSQIYDYSDLQRQLSQQLQNALNQRRYSQSSYSTPVYNPQAYQLSLDELSRELQRNLTQQLSSYRASSGSSGSYGYSSGSGSADFESMKNQLQNQLMQQLRQGLQNKYHYSASASYSASSSSSANAGYGMRQSYGTYPSNCMHGCGRRRRRDLRDYSYRHGVKSVRKTFPSQSADYDESSLRYLHHPEDLSYPQAQFHRQSSYSSHSTTSSSKQTTRSQEVEPDIVEDLGIVNNPSVSKVTKIENENLEDEIRQLEKVHGPHILRHAQKNEIPQQAMEKTHPLQKIDDDLTQQLEVGQGTSQKIPKLSGKLEDHDTQRLEVQVPNHHRILKQERNGISHSHTEHKLEDHLTLSQPTLAQQLKDQTIVGHLNSDQQTLGQNLGSQSTSWHSHWSKQYNQAQQKFGQQLEDQNFVGHLNTPWRPHENARVQVNHDQQILGQVLEDQDLVGQLRVPKVNLDQHTLGQQLEDQDLVGQLRVPKVNLDQHTLGQQLEDQDLVGQLRVPKVNLDQHTLGQQLENQDLVGQLRVPKVNLEQQTFGQQLEDQTLVGQLRVPEVNLEQQNLGQQLEDQNLVGQLRVPKVNLEQQTLGQQLEDQNLVGQLRVPKVNLEQQTLGQQLEDQNLVGQLRVPKVNLEQQTLGQQLEDQNLVGQLTLGQQLEDQNQVGQLSFSGDIKQQNDDLTEPKELLGQLTSQQQLEEQNPVSLHAPKNIYQEQQEGHDQEQQDLTQQLEIEPKVTQVQQLQEPKNQNYEQQQSNAQILEESTDQQLTDTSQQLEIARPLNKLTKIEDEDVQKLELEKSPVQQVQAIEDDLTQQLDQHVQNQEELDSQLILQSSTQNIAQKLEHNVNQKPKHPRTDVTQQIEDDSDALLKDHLENNRRRAQQKPIVRKPIPDKQITDQKLEETDQKLEEADLHLEPDQRLEESEQKLEATVQKLREPAQKLENLGQKLEEPEQKLELIGFNEQLEQKPKKNYADQEGQQLEKDSTSLEFIRRGNLKPVYQNMPTLESELSFSPDTTEKHPIRQQEVDIPSYQPHSHYDRSYEHHSVGHSVISQGQHQSRQTFGGYGQLDSQRSFTNGHSKHFSTDSSGSQAGVSTYEDALKLQENLMDILKKKVMDINSHNQNVYGKRTIKKTVFVNGKAVENQESSQLIKPNGELVELEGGLPSINVHRGQLNNLPSMYGSHKGWFSEGKPQEMNPFPGLDKTLYGGDLRSSQISGKATRTVVHYVNGKPVSASEKIQILKPNGEIIEKNHDLPTSHINPLMHNTFSNEFIGIGTPKPYTSEQDSNFSRRTIQRTSHYINGKLFDYSTSSQDVSPNAEATGLRNVESSVEHSPHSYTSGIKTSRHFGN